MQVKTAEFSTLEAKGGSFKERGINSAQMNVSQVYQDSSDL